MTVENLQNALQYANDIYYLGRLVAQAWEGRFVYLDRGDKEVPITSDCYFDFLHYYDSIHWHEKMVRIMGAPSVLEKISKCYPGGHTKHYAYEKLSHIKVYVSVITSPLADLRDCQIDSALAIAPLFRTPMLVNLPYTGLPSQEIILVNANPVLINLFMQQKMVANLSKLICDIKMGYAMGMLG